MKDERSRTLYASPFHKQYWRDAAAEAKSTKMLVVTALLVALRIVLKPLAIPLGPQLSIQTAMLATALGAMIYGPVLAIPAAIISDTLGFILFPTGEYFLPFVLTEIASTMTYALLLYRAKPSTIRVMLSRFIICFFVNVILQQLIFAWQYAYMGNPEKAKETVLGFMTLSRILKNLAMFPVETLVLTAFLRFLMPVAKRAKLVFCEDADTSFGKKQIITLMCLFLAGVITAVGYLSYRYTDTSRSADYSDRQRVQANQALTELVLERTDDWDDQTVICIVDSAYRGLFETETDYTVSVYILDEEAFANAQKQDKTYTMDTLWGYSKSGPKKDPYQTLIKVGTVTVTKNEKTDTYSNFDLTALM